MGNKETLFNKLYKVSEVLFLLIMALYLLYLMLCTSTFYFSFPSDIQKIMLLILGIITLIKTILLIISTIRYDHTFSKGLFASVAVGCIYYLVFCSDRYDFLLFLALLTIGCTGIDYRKILKVYVTVSVIFLTGTVLCALCGGIDNLVYIKDGYIRSSWGICYPTDLASYFLYLAIFIWIVRKDTKKWHMLFVCAIIIIISYYVARSSTSTICGVILFLLVLYDLTIDQISVNHKITGIIRSIIEAIIPYTFPVFSIFILGLVYSYHRKFSFAVISDQILSSRLQLAANAFETYGISLFGKPFDMIGFGGSTFRYAKYTFVDSSYPLILIRYGVIIFIVIACFWTTTTYRALKNGDRRLALSMALIAFHSISEHHFIEANYNILLVMPFSYYLESSQLETTITSDRIKVFATCLLSAILLIVFPKYLSLIRTVCSVTGVRYYSYMRMGLAVYLLVSAVLSIVTVLCFRNIMTRIFRKQKLARYTVAGLLICIIIFSAGIWKCNKMIDAAGPGYDDIIESDRSVITAIQQSGNHKLYVDNIPDLYRRKYGGISNSVFSGDELARYKNISVITDVNYESVCFLTNGFLYEQISPAHALYTNDRSLIHEMTKEGHHFTGYYSRVNDMDLDGLADMNQLQTGEKGRLLLSGSEGSLRTGPHLNLRRGTYTLEHKLHISKKQLKGKEKDDNIVCRIQVTSYGGENLITDTPIYGNQFDEKGNYVSRIRFNIDESMDVQFPVIVSSGKQVYIEKISYQQTPDYDIHVTYDTHHRKIREDYFDMEGNAVALPGGYFSSSFGYDRRDNVNIIRYYDKGGHLTLTSMGYAEIHRDFNAKRQIIREEYYDVDGKLLTQQAGHAVVEYGYDKDGNRSDIRYLDLDDKPVLFWNNYARLKQKYDDQGRIIRAEAYDTEDKPLMRQEGYFACEWDYDENKHVTSQSFYDIDNKPISGRDGYHRIDRTYNNENYVIREEYYDIHGHRITLPSGQASIEYEYDDKGNVISLKYYDQAGDPVANWSGYAGVRRKYNNQKQMISESYYDQSGKPVNCSNGYAEEKRKYDQAGNVTEQSYYDIQGHKTLRNNSYAKVEKSYDSSRHVTEEKYYGIHGEPVLVDFGYSRIERKYDDKGKLIEESYYDLKGKRVEKE